MVWRSGSPLAPAFLLLAIGIAMGTVRGRYHYVVDTVSGVVLGLAAAVSARVKALPAPSLQTNGRQV